MKVILQKDIKTLGKKGAVIEVSEGYARNYLFKNKIAVEATASNMNVLKSQQGALMKRKERDLEEAKELSKLVEKQQKELVEIMGEIEVSFDYPEEDIEYVTIPMVKKRLSALIKELDKLINTSKTGSVIKNGINAVIVGKPNVGKSSILNALINKEKAIVTDIAGTTRDIIEDAFEINGIKVNIIDTAGIRETKDKVEQIGVERSLEQINSADIILFVIDNSSKLEAEDKEIYERIKFKKKIIIANKMDKKSAYDYRNLDENILFVSAKSGKNIQELKTKIYDLVLDKNIIGGGLIITNTRHNECLKKAKEALKSAVQNIEKLTLDLVSIDISEAFSNLGELTGTTSNEVVLDSIFSKFCLGK